MLNFIQKSDSKNKFEKSWWFKLFNYLIFAAVGGLPALHYYGIILWPAYITIVLFWFLIVIIAIFFMGILQGNNQVKIKFLSSRNPIFAAYYNLFVLSVGGYFLFISGFTITAISLLTSLYSLYIYNIVGSLRIYYERRKYRKKYNA